MLFLDKYFQISEKNSSIRNEIFAGFSTFLALSYIFIVNPLILENAGFDPGVTLFATIVVSALATLAMGLWARLPFVIAPGMEMNAYVAFFAVGALGFSWQEALGMVFWSAVLMVLLTAMKIRGRIIDSIPDSLKLGLAFSVGVFLILVALSLAGILRYEAGWLRGIGSFTGPQAYALYASACVLALTLWLRLPGAVPLSILISALLMHFFGIAETGNRSATYSEKMFDGVFALDLSVILNPAAISVVLVLFVLDFYGSIAKFIGLTLNTNILEKGRVPRRTRALFVDGLGSVGASFTGTTSVTTFVESAVGIGVGGRTGLTAVTCGLLMLSCFALLPLIQYVPVIATTGALIYVGIQLMPKREALRRIGRLETVALFSMPLATIATFAIDQGMLVGFLIYLIGTLASKGRLDLFLGGSTALLAVSAVVQITGS